MITELTKEQEAQIPVFVERYSAVGTKAGKIDRDKALAYAKKLYKFLERGEPTVVFANGPKSAWLKTVLLHSMSQPDGTAGLENFPKSAEELPEDVASLSALVKTLHPDQSVQFVWPCLDGQFMAPWVAWAKFMQYIGVELSTDISIIEDQLEFNVIYPLEKYCIFSDRFLDIHMKGGRLHCDGGPSVEYADGTKCWTLNGIAVPQWIAETPWDKLDCRKFAEISNAEVRREFIRKVGVERLCTQLGSKMIDKQGDYELHVIDLLGTTGEWPYLKMLNPSVGCWHMECVGKDCKTVAEALKFRNGSDLTPTVLT